MTSTPTATPTPASDPGILQRPAPNPVAVGANINLLLVVRSDGPGPATNVVVTDPLPPNAVFVSATPQQGRCAQSGQTVTCALGNLAVGAITNIRLVLQATSAAAGTTLVNTATVAANELDVDPSDNTASATIFVLAPPATVPPDTATPTATSTATPTGAATSAATTTITAMATGTRTSTTTVTATATNTGTIAAPATALPAPSSCVGIGAVCHSDLTVVPNADALTGVQFLWASERVVPGPCLSADQTNCVETVTTGSFTVRVRLDALLPGDTPLLRIPVITATGALAGSRELTCPPAGPDGISVCPGFIGDPGIFPQLGGVAEVFLTRPTPPAPVGGPPTPVGPLVPPLLPPLLPPPSIGLAPAPLLPPLLPGALSALRAEVPIVPEAPTVGTVLLGLLGLAGWAMGRRRE